MRSAFRSGRCLSRDTSHTCLPCWLVMKVQDRADDAVGKEEEATLLPDEGELMLTREDDESG